MQALSFDLVLFGGTGDLAMRKLLPALYRRHLAGQLSADSRIICVARSEYDDEKFGAYAANRLREYLGRDFDESHWTQFRSRLKYQSLDANDAESFSRIASELKGREELTRIFFLSTAPNIFGAICNGLAGSQIITPASRIVLEKPLGHDAASAAEINSIVASIFREHQVYRIDHYLGKETVQNLLALRFGNTLFEPLWRRGRVRQVQITVAEQIGVETRGNFYDQTGALRDMVQNHLLQLLCIIAMEPPASSDPNALRDEKLKVLRALRPLAGRDVLAKTVRGQYKSGAVNGVPVVGYLAEAGVPADSGTETFVALKAEIDTWRWAGVPFYLRTGKRLQDRLVEISLTLEDVPHQIFEQPLPAQSPNRLVIRLQPDESITLTVLAKSPGEGMVLKPVNLSLDLAGTFKTRPLEAYERLLMDVVKGNLTLFMRRDELDAAWRWIDPIREAWQKYDERPRSYNSGTWGPTAASALLNRDGFVWHDEL